MILFIYKSRLPLYILRNEWKYLWASLPLEAVASKPFSSMLREPVVKVDKNSDWLKARWGLSFFTSNFLAVVWRHPSLNSLPTDGAAAHKVYPASAKMFNRSYSIKLQRESISDGYWQRDRRLSRHRWNNIFFLSQQFLFGNINITLINSNTIN